MKRNEESRGMREKGKIEGKKENVNALAARWRRKASGEFTM